MHWQALLLPSDKNDEYVTRDRKAPFVFGEVWEREIRLFQRSDINTSMLPDFDLGGPVEHEALNSIIVKNDVIRSWGPPLGTPRHSPCRSLHLSLDTPPL